MNMSLESNVDLLPRRRIVVWWRELWPTLGAAIATVVYPSRFCAIMLGLIALADWALAVCAEDDAANWHEIANEYRNAPPEEGKRE